MAMKKIAFFFLVWIHFLSAQSTISLESNGSLAIFPIHPVNRAADILHMFTTLQKSPFKTNQSQVSLQTTRNGLIINVQGMTLATNKTLILVSYLPPTSLTVMQFIVLPIEQIVEVIYSLKALTTSASFSAPSADGVLPLFSVDLAHRAADIKEIFDILNTDPTYQKRTSSVSLQTTLRGSYLLGSTGLPSITNGLIPNIQNISLTEAPNGTMLLVRYLSGVLFGTVIVTPDQVYEVVYSPN
jgi:hypothetical protein